MSRTITIELTMPKALYKRYQAVGKKTGDDTVVVVASVLTLFIDYLEKTTIKKGG